MPRRNKRKVADAPPTRKRKAVEPEEEEPEEVEEEQPVDAESDGVEDDEAVPSDEEGGEEDEDEGEDGEDEDEEEEPEYSGAVNAEGLPHGRGTLKYAGGTVFEGRFENGVKSGKGLFKFDDGNTLSGNFQDDALQGPGVYTEENGDVLHGTYVDGSLNGPAKQFNKKGKLSFEGTYKDDVRCGFGVLHNPDGGWYEGNFDENTGAIHGDITYFFAPNLPVLRGKWEHGEMKNAAFYTYKELDKSSKPPKREYYKINHKDNKNYKLDQSTDTIISRNLQKPDFYEQAIVYVKESTIPNSGEGLFAKIDIPPNTVVSFYNGTRNPDLTKDKEWYQNKNAIQLDDVTVIDVPVPHDSTDNYTASLGHKCNHTFYPNATYDKYDHPRFGRIKCIRALDRPIKKDEEIFVCYGYEMKNGVPHAPAWYLKGWQDIVDKKKYNLPFACEGCFIAKIQSDNNNNTKKSKNSDDNGHRHKTNTPKTKKVKK